MKNTVRYHDELIESLKNPANAAAYLDAVAEDGDIRFLLKALRNVVEAQGGVGALSRKTHLSRPTLYRTLSKAGNPEIKTLSEILGIYGLRLAFSPMRRHALEHAAAR